MDVRKRLGTIEDAHDMADGAITPLSHEGSIGILSSGLLMERTESQIIDPNNHPSKSLTYLLNHKPLRFTVREWYGDIEHILLEDAGTHLVYCVGCGDGAWYIVNVYRDPNSGCYIAGQELEATISVRSYVNEYKFLEMKNTESEV